MARTFESVTWSGEFVAAPAPAAPASNVGGSQAGKAGTLKDLFGVQRKKTLYETLRSAGWDDTTAEHIVSLRQPEPPAVAERDVTAAIIEPSPEMLAAKRAFEQQVQRIQDLRDEATQRAMLRYLAALYKKAELQAVISEEDELMLEGIL